MPKTTAAQLAREINQALRNPRGKSKTGTWAVEAGRGLTYDRGDGRGPLLMFNLHRHVEPRTGSSYISPVDLDEITHEIATFLNRQKRKLKPSPGY